MTTFIQRNANGEAVRTMDVTETTNGFVVIERAALVGLLALAGFVPDTAEPTTAAAEVNA